MKAKASLKLAEVEKSLVDGASEKLQLLHTCSYGNVLFVGQHHCQGVHEADT